MRVVRAARAAFASQGYAGATMRGIAADAGLTAMALYTYASSKQGLFQLVYEEGIAQIYAEFSDVVRDKASLLDEVQAVFDRGGAILERDPDLLHFTIRVMMDHDHEDLRELNLVTEPYLEFFRQMAARAVLRREMAAGDSNRLVGFVTMLLWGITTAAALDPDNVQGAVETAAWAARGRLPEPRGYRRRSRLMTGRSR